MDLTSLNNNQRAAVEAVNNPVLIFAGAGSGKTRVLAYKIAYLLDQGIVVPEDVLAVTFTNKAAVVMRERVTRLIKEKHVPLNIGTFHSICARILRNDIKHLGFTSDFAIYDATDQVALLKVVMADMGVPKNSIMPKTARNRISYYKNKLIAHDVAMKSARTIQDRTIVDIYKVYQKALKKNNALDFDDLLNYPLEIFENHPGILGKYRKNGNIYWLMNIRIQTGPNSYWLKCLLKNINRSALWVMMINQYMVGVVPIFGTFLILVRHSQTVRYLLWRKTTAQPSKY